MALGDGGGAARLIPPRWRNELDAQSAKALTGELIGTLFFVFLSNLSGTPLAVGLAFTVTSYATAPLSGGHLNPAITVAQGFSGHIHWALAGMYVVAQLLGAVAGSLLQSVLVPSIHHIGRHRHGLAPPGCVHPAANIGWFSLILWEFVLTFLFISVVYATTSGSNKFTPVFPLAAGLAIYVATEAGGAYTGAILNPARLVGPAIVWLCGWKRFWLYIVGHLLASIAAALFAVGNFGQGPAYADNREGLGEGLGERLMPESDI